MEFAGEGGEGATPYEVLLHDAMEGDRASFTREDSMEEKWRIVQPLLDAPGRRSTPTRRARGDHRRRDRLLAGVGRWHEPWTAVMSGTAAKKPDEAAGATAEDRMPQSAAAPSPFPPIADYAFLSNCHTSALVAPDGGDRLALRAELRLPERLRHAARPRRPGSFRIGPFGINVPTSRHYVPGTNMLDDDLARPTGWVVVRDALTMGPRRGEDTVTPHTRPPADDDGDHLLVRTVECHRGRAWRSSSSASRSSTTGACRRPGRCADEDRHAADAAGADVDAPPDDRHGARRRGRPRARSPRAPGGRAALLLAVLGRGPRGARRRSTRPSSAWPTTTRFWRSLARAAPGCPTTAGARPIQRSALAIKGLTYMPTGATVAALTTSLPETPGGERNWDYRYTWMRDSTFTLQALHFLDLDWEADEFMQFIADLEPNEDGALQIMYGIDGRRDLTESTRDDLSGYAGARPVRVGNGAFDQRQNDVFGAVLDSILLHTRRSQRLPRRLWPIVQSRRPSARAGSGASPTRASGRRAASRSTTSPPSSCAGSRWTGRAEARRHPRRRASCRRAWRATAEEIRADILEHGVDGRGVLRQHYETDALDASTLLAAIFGFLPARRRAPARERPGDRRRADRGRLRPALPHGRDRRRPVGQGGHAS